MTTRCMLPLFGTSMVQLINSAPKHIQNRFLWQINMINTRFGGSFGSNMQSKSHFYNSAISMKPFVLFLKVIIWLKSSAFTEGNIGEVGVVIKSTLKMLVGAFNELQISL